MFLMTLRWMAGAFGLLGFLLVWAGTVWAQQQRLEVEEPLKSELNALLKGAVELHEALFERKPEHELRLALDNLDQALGRAQRLAGSGGIQRVHVDSVLTAARSHLELVQQREGAERMRHMRELFRALVQVNQSFDLDRYRVFFCSRDRAVWLQSGWQVRNPFEPKRGGGCGQAVR